MNIEKLREVIRKYEEKTTTTSTIKRMTRFSSGTRYSTRFQNVWLAPKANERSFPELFADARKEVLRADRQRLCLSVERCCENCEKAP